MHCKEFETGNDLWRPFGVNSKEFETEGERWKSFGSICIDKCPSHYADYAAEKNIPVPAKHREPERSKKTPDLAIAKERDLNEVFNKISFMPAEIGLGIGTILGAGGAALAAATMYKAMERVAENYKQLEQEKKRRIEIENSITAASLGLIKKKIEIEKMMAEQQIKMLEEIKNLPECYAQMVVADSHKGGVIISGGSVCLKKTLGMMVIFASGGVEIDEACDDLAVFTTGPVHVKNAKGNLAIVSGSGVKVGKKNEGVSVDIYSRSNVTVENKDLRPVQYDDALLSIYNDSGAANQDHITADRFRAVEALFRKGYRGAYKKLLRDNGTEALFSSMKTAIAGHEKNSPDRVSGITCTKAGRRTPFL